MVCASCRLAFFMPLLATASVRMGAYPQERSHFKQFDGGPLADHQRLPHRNVTWGHDWLSHWIASPGAEEPQSRAGSSTQHAARRAVPGPASKLPGVRPASRVEPYTHAVVSHDFAASAPMR